MKALMSYAGSENPVYAQPFTVVDPRGFVWTVATNLVWLVAVKDRGAAPRFRGEFNALGTVLKMLRMEPAEAVEFESKDVLKRLDPEGLGRILGVVVSMRRLQDLLAGIPAEKLTAWNVTGPIGLPALAFASEGWRAFLMGFRDSYDVDDFSLLPPGRELFDLAMGLDDA